MGRSVDPNEDIKTFLDSDQLKQKGPAATFVDSKTRIRKGEKVVYTDSVTISLSLSLSHSKPYKCVQMERFPLPDTDLICGRQFSLLSLLGASLDFHKIERLIRNTQYGRLVHA